MSTVTPHSNRQQLYLVFIVTTVLWVIADQLSKLWVRTHMIPGTSRLIKGILSFTYLTNTGGVFGLFSGHVEVFTITSIVIIVVLLFFHFYLEVNHPLPNFAFGLIMGGALGNLIDRMFFGKVTDFIDIRLWNNYHWAPFNLADSGVVAGTILVIIMIAVLGKLPPRN